MSFCQNCGTKLVNGAKFCSGCGALHNNAAISQNNTVPQQNKKFVASQYFSGAWVNVAPFNVSLASLLRLFLDNLPDKNICFDDVLVFFNGLVNSCGNIGFIVTSEKLIGFDKKNQFFNIPVAHICDVSWSPSLNIFAPMSDHLKIRTASKQWDLIYGANELKTGKFCQELKAFAIAHRNNM